jgi:hypothetical protein
MFKYFFTNSRAFKALNFCFQIQGLSRTFKDIQGFSSTFKDFQGHSRTFKDFQAHSRTFKEVYFCANPEHYWD